MKKRIISGTLVAVLGAAAFTGCGAKAEDVFAQNVEGEITVSCYETTTYKSYLEEAARKFEEKYPGTKVNVETAAAMPEIKTQESGNGMSMSIMQFEENQQERDDYISKVNTELMSGKGADVIALDILPYYKYADSGQLVDLNSYMEDDGAFNKSDYAENIIDGTKYKGGQFLFPIDYTFNYFAYDSSLEPNFPVKDKLTFSEVINAVKDQSKETGNKIFGLPGYMLQGTMDMISSLFVQDYEKYIDIANKTVNLNDGEFANLLETVKAYADEGYINEARVTANDGERREISMAAFEQSQQEKYYAKSNSNFSMINLFTRGLGLTNRIMVGGVGSGDSSNDEIAGLIANEQGDVQFSYSMGFGINSNSANKRTAWEFLKFLASEEMQTSGLARPDTIPVNKNASAQLAKMNITGEAMQARAVLAGSAGAARGDGSTGEEPANKELTPEQQAALENYLYQLNEFSVLLNKHIVVDEKITAMMKDEVKYYFTGEKTADEVANALQSKVSLYINE